MALQLFCPTEYAVLLVAVPGNDGIFHFPSAQQSLPGIGLQVKPLLGINPQLMAAAAAALGLPSLAQTLTINQEFAGKLSWSDGKPATLFVGTLEHGVVEPKAQWLTLPELLAAMPKDRNRLPYVLAWQVLTGALAQTVQALEVDDQLLPIVRPAKDELTKP